MRTVERLEIRCLLAGFAPSSLAGALLHVLPGSSDLPYADQSGGYELRLSASDNTYSIRELNGPDVAGGTYSYTKVRARNGVLRLTDGAGAGTFSTAMRFDTPVSGTELVFGPAGDQRESSGFVIGEAPGAAPESIAGLRLVQTISGADSVVLSGEGAFRLLPAAASTYLLKRIRSVVNSGGTYEYARTAPAQGRITFSDALIGAGTAELTFLTGSGGTGSGGFYRIDRVRSEPGITDFQEGVFAVEGASATGGGGAAALAAAIEGPLPASVFAGSSARQKVRVTNSGPGAHAGLVVVRLFASGDDVLDAGDVPVATVNKILRLPPGASKVVPAAFAYPEDLPAGAYHLLARAGDSGPAAASADAVTIEPAFVDLSASLLPPAAGRKPVATVTVRNDGNVQARTVNVQLFRSGDAVLDDGDAQLAFFDRTLRLKPRASRTLRLSFARPDGVGPGTYLLAWVTTNDATVERDLSGNLASVLFA